MGKNIEDLKSAYNQFMYKQSQKDFELLKKYIMKPIIIDFTIDGSTKKLLGVLTKVNDFKNIVVSGKIIPFIGDKVIIRSISLKNKEKIYDRTHLISGHTKVIPTNKNILTQKILGIESPKDSVFGIGITTSK